MAGAIGSVEAQKTQYLDASYPPGLSDTRSAGDIDWRQFSSFLTSATPSGQNDRAELLDHAAID
jgi:hypothetical protein